MSKEKVKLNISMEVTIPQALALKAMFEKWNFLSSNGSSKNVSFFVDGDGNFHPKCVVSTDKELPELTDEFKKLALTDENDETLFYDFDNIAWKLEE